jgi:hypothetical protein
MVCMAPTNPHLKLGVGPAWLAWPPPTHISNQEWGSMAGMALTNPSHQGAWPLPTPFPKEWGRHGWYGP